MSLKEKDDRQAHWLLVNDRCLLRNDGGRPPDFPDIKEAYRVDNAGPEWLKCGTIIAKDGRRGTPGAACCPILTIEMAENAWLLA